MFFRRVMPKAQTFACCKRKVADGLEVLEVLGVRKRVAALDEIDAELVEPAGEEELVLQGEVHALALAAVAKGGVVDGYFHGYLLFALGCWPDRAEETVRSGWFVDCWPIANG